MTLDRFLFRLAEFLSRPPGFYAVLVLMALCTLLVPFGWTNAVTYVLSVAAIVITGVVLIQGFRDTVAIHAKLDEIVVALKATRNEVVGLEHCEPAEIEAALVEIEKRAEADIVRSADTPTAGAKADNIPNPTPKSKGPTSRGSVVPGPASWKH